MIPEIERTFLVSVYNSFTTLPQVGALADGEPIACPISP